MRRSVVGLVAAAAFMAAVGWLYQLVGQRRDERHFSPPGRLVDVGGRRLHIIERAGTGNGPSVVVLPALGTPAVEWQNVFAALPAGITAYAVDRGGIGWSDPAPPLPRTPLVLADEATALLDALELSSVVLVGHSYGGIAARVTAARHPGRVVGLLLVDSSHEQQARQLAQRDPRIPRSEIWRRAARRQMRSLGWYRAWHDLTAWRALLREAVDEVGEQLAPAVVARSLRTASRRAVVGEMVGIALAPYVTPDWAQRLGDLPTTVLTVGDGHAWGPAYPTWFELHQSFLAMSTCARHVVLDGTGHHMNHDVPHEVAGAITDLVDKAHRHGTRSP
ncbi:alpha/beta fold hydrolase [Amycolatopsis sp. WAC 04197]|uniref:alpha/beta fold hydrolase n=1 Tax=Amycolatopsis sp. WAC 04197 TaxID=2203199 RepID=UPI001315A754|nr:alpha/beta hydrolase [Amycolatopsis sp. WAC 04197]